MTAADRDRPPRGDARRRHRIQRAAEAEWSPWTGLGVSLAASAGAWAIVEVLTRQGVIPESRITDDWGPEEWILLAAACFAVMWVGAAVRDNWRNLRISFCSMLLFQVGCFWSYGFFPHFGPWALEGELRGHPGQVADAAFDLASKRVVTADIRGEVRVWDAGSREALAALAARAAPATAARFSPDGDVVATAGVDGKVRLWRWGAAAGPREIAVPGGSLSALAYSPDGTRLATASADGAVRLWDLESGSCVATSTLDGQGVLCVAFSPDGACVAAGCALGAVAILSGNDLTELGRFACATGRVTSAGFSAAGGRIVAAAPGFSGDRSGAIEVDLPGGARRYAFTFFAHPSASVSPDGLRVLTPGHEGLLIWDVRLYDLLWRSGGGDDRLYRLARYSADGRRFVAVTAGGVPEIWRRRRNEEIWGLATLPSFWASLFFPSLFIWSLRRDSQRYWDRARAEPVPADGTGLD